VYIDFLEVGGGPSTFSLLSNATKIQFTQLDYIIGPAGSGDVSSIQLLSTVEGLGSAGYLSSYSTVVFQAGLNSTLDGLGTLGFISSIGASFSTIVSTVEGLGSTGYLSSYSTAVFESELVSTVEGLGSVGYLSSYSTVVFQNELVSTLEGLGSAGYISSVLSTSLTTGNMPVRQYYLMSTSLYPINSSIILVCDTLDSGKSDGNFSASYNTTTGYLSNPTPNNLTIGLQAKIAGPNGSPWLVSLKDGATQSTLFDWINNTCNIYNSDYNTNFILHANQSVYLDFLEVGGGPSTFSLLSNATRVQFTQLDYIIGPAGSGDVSSIQLVSTVEGLGSTGYISSIPSMITLSSLIVSSITLPDSNILYASANILYYNNMIVGGTYALSYQVITF
jgi:hypothetical protein